MASPASSQDDELTLSLPSLAFVAVLTLFAIRWFWTSRSSGSSATSSSRSPRQINPEHVEQISQMFPQLNRRDIMWDLRRNGGSVTATTERILQGRGLERRKPQTDVSVRDNACQPPPSFQPEIPPPSSAPYTASTPSTPTPKDSDLITRYNLQSRIAEEEQQQQEGSDAHSSPSAGWSTNKVERASILKKRRDDMILAARRKMMAKDKAAQAEESSS